MSLRKSLALSCLVLILPLCAFGQRAEFYGANYPPLNPVGPYVWSPFLANGRAENWAGGQVGFTLPTLTQCGSTIAAYGSSGSPGSPSTINSAIAACSSGTYVLLGSGTFYLTPGIHLYKAGVVLYGSGPQATTIVFSGSSGQCNICLQPSTTYYAGSSQVLPGGANQSAWTAGYSQGTTTITLATGLSGLSSGTMLILDQANQGSVSPFGYASDTGGWWSCDWGGSSNACQDEGVPNTANPIGRVIGTGHTWNGGTNWIAANYSQMQTVIVQSYNSSTGATVISPGIYATNYDSSHTPGAWWPPTVSNVGIANLTIDNTASSDISGIEMNSCIQCFVTNVASIDANRNHVWFYQGYQDVVTNSYFYKSQNSAQDSYGVEPFIASDCLIQNNIFQQVSSPLLSNQMSGCVIAYNATHNQPYSPSTSWQLAGITVGHNAGSVSNLIEGNYSSTLEYDDVWGTGNPQNTVERNWLRGQDYNGSSGIATLHTGIVIFDAGNRGPNLFANVFGPASGSYYTNYKYTAPTSVTQANCNKAIFNLGYGGEECGNDSSGGIPNDSLVGSTISLCGNYDVVNGATQWTRGECSPSSAGASPNTIAANTGLPVALPYTASIPASFYLSSQPAFWNVPNVSIPFPPIGPDVTSGPGPGGHGYYIPAENCYSSILGGPANGTGSALAFDAANCYDNLAGPLGFAALPTSWVNSLSAPNGSDNPVFYPASGTYDQTITLGTSVNHGPNLTSGSLGSTYPATLAGFLDAINNWRDNGANTTCALRTACSSPVDAWWLVQVPAGTSLHGSSYDANSALVSLPGKSSSGSSMVEVTKGLVIDSTTPLTAGQIVCSHGLPGFGGTRNPGCASPNDKSSMFTLKMDSIGGATDIPMYAGADLVTATNYVNHILIADMESTMAPGAAQSKSGVTPTQAFFRAPPNIFGTTPPTAPQNVDYVAVIRSYFHGWNPGDSGQPTTGASVDGSGNCLGWYNSGTVNIVNNGATATITLTSTTPALAFGNTFFGPTFTVGSSINFGGTMSGAGGNITGGSNFVISAFDPTTSNTVLTVTTVGSNPATATGVAYLQINPPSQYTPGCGDDAEAGVNWNVNNGWFQDNYIEKIHWWQGESHALSYAFASGPTKITHNWIEPGAAGIFSGGSPIDSQGGPSANNEIRGNAIIRDLNWRLLSASAGNSPVPPWGCGPFDGTPSHNTCPFSWGMKNNFELKIGDTVLIDGNIISGIWPDAQSGFCMLINEDAGSGGQAVGVFDPITGLPKTYIKNIRISNNWFRDCAQPIQMLNRGDMSPADGGGVTLGAQGYDFINNLFSNISDTNQFGSPGHQWQWTTGGGKWTCAMGYTGSGPYTVTATCAPYQTDLTNPAHVSNITVDGSHNVTILHGGIRLDPTLSTSASGTCITSGASWTTCPVVVSGITGLTNGSFAMTSAGSTNWATDGTGGTEIVYNDGASAAGTLCSSTSTCTTLLGGSAVLTFASLGGKLTDISVGDGVYAANVGGGDTTCTGNGYAVGATSATYAISGTLNTGLVVKYSMAAQPSSGSANCLIDNGVGFPKNTTVQNNTFLAPGVFAITASNQFFQPIANYFFNNVFADVDALTRSDVYGGTEGTPAFAYWDNNTFQFYSNVLMGRSSSNWSVVNCPGGSCANSFPALTGSFPTGACANSDAPFNCPLMAAPWASNFALSDLSTMSVSSATQGVNPSQLTNALTQTEYVCPVGASCGSHGPFPE